MTQCRSPSKGANGDSWTFHQQEWIVPRIEEDVAQHDFHDEFVVPRILWSAIREHRHDISTA